MVLGASLLTIDLPPQVFGHDNPLRRARLLVEEEPAVVVEEPPPEPEDLSESPELDQVESLAAEPPPAEVTPGADLTPAETTPAAEPRRIYGVRRVFSSSLGSGRGGTGTMVGKRGNTLDPSAADAEANAADLAGPLVPLSTVTTAPDLVHRVKPKYTREMIEEEVEGVVKAKLLVDVDGHVKEVEILQDIGFGSRDAATEAFLQLRFRPAMREGEPVAVWIKFTYRFVLQE
jgi:protein TonB